MSAVELRAQVSDYATVKLSKGLVALVDPDDLPLVSAYQWHAMERRRSGEYQASSFIDGHRVLMHRLIMGARPGQFLDHRNHDSLDNRKSNLRFCTIAENCRNSRKRNRNGSPTSKYKGVCRHRQNGKWSATIVVNRRHITLGQFKNERDAARAYDAAALQHFGEFACLNFPRRIAV